MLHTYRGTSHFCGLHSIKVFSIEYQRVADTQISSEKFLHMSVTKKKKIETSVQLTFFLFNWICLVLHTLSSVIPLMVNSVSLTFLEAVLLE